MHGKALWGADYRSPDVGDASLTLYQTLHQPKPIGSVHEPARQRSRKRPHMAPLYVKAWLPRPWRVRRRLVGVNVVRPVGRSTLTPRARRRGGRLPGKLVGEGVAWRVRVRAVACPKGRPSGLGRPRWTGLLSSPGALPGPPGR